MTVDELSELEFSTPLVAIFADDLATVVARHLRASVTWTVNMVARERHLWPDGALGTEAGAAYVTMSFRAWQAGAVHSAVASGLWRLYGRDMGKAQHGMFYIERAVTAAVRGLVPSVIKLALLGVSVDDIIEQLTPMITTRAAWVRSEAIGALTADQ